jgi:hypothetical protein
MEEGGKKEVYNAVGEYKLFQSIRCCPNRNEPGASRVKVPSRRKKSPGLKTRATAVAVRHRIVARLFRGGVFRIESRKLKEYAYSENCVIL